MKIKVIAFLFLFPILFSGKTNAQTNPNDSLITEALALVNEDSLQMYVQSLQDIGTRFMIAPNRKEVAEWIMNQFIAMGFTEVRLDSFQCYTNVSYQILQYDTTTWQYNVEAKITGKTYPDREVLVLGHHDNVTLDGDPMLFAPGADDNASGTAAVLECARIIMEMGYEPEQTLVFLTAAAEELMYFGHSGAIHYSEQASTDQRNIVMVINNDMIGWDNGTWTVNIFNHTQSTHITALALDIITNFTSLNYYSTSPQSVIGGDLQPFLDEGFPGIYFMERGNYPFYHSDNDIIDHMSMPYLAEVTKISLGMILHSDLEFTNIHLIQSGDALITFFPNPAHETIQIASSCEIEYYSIYNTAGQIVLSGKIKGAIDISILEAGYYIIQLQTENGIVSHKLIIY